MSPAMNIVPLPTPLDAYTENLVTQAKTDLAQRLSIDASKVELIEVSQVTWPDGSLGCPQPGMMYTQSLVDGLRIRFSVDGKEYAYHSGGNKTPFLCENK